jgi:septum formation protein
VRLYLASTSPARLALLRAAGIEPIVLDPAVDEDAVAAAAGPLPVHEAVQVLARAKAEAVADATIDGIIVGGDSLFELAGTVYGKPHHPEVARERWRDMRGRTGTLHSGTWVIDHRGGVAAGGLGGVSSADVSFAHLSDEEIAAYVETGEPLKVAGAFTIDSLGSAYITSVQGDPHTVVGLSVALLRELVGQFGIPWHSLWNRSAL